MYDEIARILRVTRNNVEYEAERNKSQLLCDVATTLDNLATLVDNISVDIKAREISRKRASETPPITSTWNVSQSEFITLLYNVSRETKYKLFHVEH